MAEIPKGLLGRAGLIGVPLPRDLARGLMGMSNYKPEPPEACECGIVGPATPREGSAIMHTGVSWKKCTSFGSIDGSFPLVHTRIGDRDYLFTAIQLRMCRRVR